MGSITLAVYLGGAWFFLPPQTVWSPDAGAKLIQLQNLHWENGRLNYAILYPGQKLDPDLKFAFGAFIEANQGALYFRRLPLFPLLTLPFFQMFGFYGLYLLPALGGVVSSVLALQLLQRRDQRLAMWLVIAFASPIFIYATIFWEHNLATALALVAAWLTLNLPAVGYKGPLRGILGWIGVGILLGISIYIRQEIVIFAGAWLFALWLIIKEKRWGAIWAGLALTLILLPYVPLHRLMFSGQSVPDNARYLFYPLNYLTYSRWRAIPDLLIGPAEDHAIDAGWLGWVWASAAIVAIISSFDPTNSKVLNNVRLLSLAVTALVAATFLFNGTYYRAAHGLLFTTPWALLGICRAREVWQQGDRHAQTVVLTTLLGLIGYTMAIIGFRATTPQGGLEWGARFAMTFYPLLALSATWDLGAKRREVKTLVIYGSLIFLGFGFQIRGMGLLYHDKHLNASLNQALRKLPTPYLVSDLWWIPLDTAPIYPQKAIFVANTPEKLKEWVELAAAHQVRQFSVITLNEHLLGQVQQILTDSKLVVIEARQMRNLLLFQVAIEPH